MIVFKKAEQLTSYIARSRKAGKKVGFVPTMGALHDGHFALIRSAKSQADLTVSSIFVNPTQFNNPEDYHHYPITVERDLEQLLLEGCDALFLPSISEIYPQGHRKKHYELGFLEDILEGHYRPGHFQGVCQVVDRLLDIVNPDYLFLGQKDFQQCMVLKKLLALTHRDKHIQLIIVPTVREKNGLAMSSRNLRLSAVEKEQALGIYDALKFINNNLGNYTTKELELTVADQLKGKGFEPDYVSIVNRLTLQIPQSKTEPLVALIAASLNKVRLIDNSLLNE
jgi:pantoate--beta-alanine ligase